MRYVKSKVKKFVAVGGVPEKFASKEFFSLLIIMGKN